MVANGVSKTLESLHVVDELHPFSRAIDAAPYPVVWPTRKMEFNTYVDAIGRFYHFAGYTKKTAELLGIKIRWGGDWNSNNIFSDQAFDDLDHFELIEG